MKYFYVLLVFIFSACVLSCSGSKYSAVTVRPGNFSFSMSDSTGTTLIEGDMQLDTTSMDRVFGTYSITKKYNTDFPGYSTMGGKFDGIFERSTGMVHLNMNPKLADANIFVKAKIFRNSFAGEWSFSTIRGVKASGSFVAKSKD